MKNVCYSALAIGLCLLAGKIIAATLNGLPASLYGMIIFTSLLHFKVLSADKIQQTITWIITHMGVCFVPAGVGIINHFDLLKQHGIAIIAIIFFSTFLLLSVVGLWFERLLKDKPSSDSEPSP